MSAIITESRRRNIKALIEGAGSRFIAVEFVKKDGSFRKIQVQPAALKNRLVGDAASDAAKKAVATRKANHPNLYPVFDVAAGAIKSINLDTVLAVTVDKTRFDLHTQAA